MQGSEAQFLQGFDDDDLVLVGDVGEEIGYLSKQSINIVFRYRFEENGHDERGDGSV